MGTGEYGLGAAYPLLPEMTDLDRKLEHMDAGGVEVSVLSVNIPGLDMFDAALAGPAEIDGPDVLCT